MASLACAFSSVYFFVNLAIFISTLTSYYPRYPTTQALMMYVASWVISVFYAIAEITLIPYISDPSTATVMGVFVLMDILFNHGSFVSYM